MLDHAADRFGFIYNKYLKDNNTNVYFSIVLDKNYFLAEKNGYLSIDYDNLISYMKEKTDYMTYIDITDKLSIDDYYATDTHWKQEEIIDVAALLAESMDVPFENNFAVNKSDVPFYGVYYGQSALPLEVDTLKYVYNDSIKNAKVKYLNETTFKMEDGDLYTLEKFKESQRRLSLKGSSRNTSSTIAAERSGDVYHE
jgi:hypothetical protein